MTTHSYTVCEQQQYERYDGMPREDSRVSGGIGCGGGSTRGTHFFRHDPLEEELDPCLSAAVRYQKEKGTRFIRMRYFLCCLIVLLALALIAFAFFNIFSTKHSQTNNEQRISTVNGSGNEWASSQMEDVTSRTDVPEVKTTEQIEVVLLVWDILELGPQIDRENTKRIVQEVQTKTGKPLPPPPRPVPPKPMTTKTTTATTTRTMRPRPPMKITRPTLAPTQPPRKVLVTAPIKKVTTTTTTSKPQPIEAPKQRSNRRIHDCEHHSKMGHKSGVHKLSVDNYEFYAYCEMDSRHGWTTLQRRSDDKVPFWNATFNEYADGFGHIPDGDHWLGLEPLWAIGDNRKMEMRIQLEGDQCNAKACSGFGEAGMWQGIWEFTIGSRADAYRISNLKFIRGNLSDTTDPNADMFSFLCNNGRFTTVDMDNDENKEENCALQRYRGGWWHRDCAYTALNGRYGNTGKKSGGFYWLWKSAQGHAMRSYTIKPKKSKILFRVVQ